MNEATFPATSALTGTRSLEAPVASEGAPPSAVSWTAVLAGAAAAAALSMILLVLGTGLGLSSVSPWSGQGASGTTIGVSSIVWLTLTQLAAAAMGGYLAGRLRTRWNGTHKDEVYFRDTAHGFLAWAVASLTTAALLTGAIGSIVNGGAQAGAAVAGGAVTAAVGAVGPMAMSAGGDAKSGASAYVVDSLFRAPDASGTSGTAANPANEASSLQEVARIIANGMASGSLPKEDVQYVARLVSQRTGLSSADAEKRVNDAFSMLQTKAKEAEAAARSAADKARKASAYLALWLFVSLLGAAFVSSLAATYGGRRRDLY